MFTYITLSYNIIEINALPIRMRMSI